ncbi:MAG: glycosyltransferase, partial [Lachnospiraceae bacterium]
MTASSTVYAVIVTYNRKKMLTKCLDAVLNQTRLVNTIIIIDNNSTDQTEDYLRQNGYLKKEQIQYVKLAENIGGAGGFYEGMKLARENAADWIWIMDDDVIPDKTCLEELLKAKDSIPEKVSFFASSIRGINGEALNVPKINRN